MRTLIIICILGVTCGLAPFVFFGKKSQSSAPTPVKLENPFPSELDRGDPIQIFSDGGVSFPSTFGKHAKIVTDTIDGKKVVVVTFDLPASQPTTASTTRTKTRPTTRIITVQSVDGHPWFEMPYASDLTEIAREVEKRFGRQKGAIPHWWTMVIVD